MLTVARSARRAQPNPRPQVSLVPRVAVSKLCFPATRAEVVVAGVLSPVRRER